MDNEATNGNDEVEVKYNDNAGDIYKHQWRAFYKNGVNNTCIVYGETEADAMKNALAEYRRNLTGMSNMPLDKVVDRVEFIG